MTSGFSHYLNLLRVIAAFTVFGSHLAYERFTRGDYLFIREWDLGSDAVILFFVLSGFVIAYTACEKDKTASQYVFARASRLYSVVIPAIILTLAFDYFGSKIDPVGYDGWWWNPAPVWETLLRSLSFSTEWTGSAFRPGTNGPFWSLSYEAAYYALFGIAIFLNGWVRVLLLGMVLALAGIKVLLLMPAWLCGVWFYFRASSMSIRPVLAYIFFVGPLVVYIIALFLKLPDHFLALTAASIGQGAVNTLRFSSGFVWSLILGVLVTLHLIAAINFFTRRPRKTVLNSLVSWLSGASFSIYLVHYPALQFWHAVLPNSPASVLRDILLFGVTLLTCLIFASAFERPLPRFRRVARGIGTLLHKRFAPVAAREDGKSVR